MGGQEMGKLELEGPQRKRMQTSPHAPTAVLSHLSTWVGTLRLAGEVSGLLQGLPAAQQVESLPARLPLVSDPPAAPAGEVSLAHLVVVTSILPSPCGGPVPP